MNTSILNFLLRNRPYTVFLLVLLNTEIAKILIPKPTAVIRYLISIYKYRIPCSDTDKRGKSYRCKCLAQTRH